MNMISRLHLSTIVGIAIAIWAVMLVIEGVAVSVSWLRPFSPVIGVVLLLVLAFDRWLWRIRLLHGWFVKRPVLRGLWKIELRSEWKDPVTCNRPAAIEAYLVVRQTYSYLSLRLLTKESSSETLAADIVEAADGTFRVYAVYRNEPRPEFRDRSPIHYGALLIDFEGYPERLGGNYWTDRNSRGQLTTTGHLKKVCSSYHEARSAFQKSQAQAGRR